MNPGTLASTSRLIITKHWLAVTLAMLEEVRESHLILRAPLESRQGRECGPFYRLESACSEKVGDFVNLNQLGCVGAAVWAEIL